MTKIDLLETLSQTRPVEVLWQSHGSCLGLVPGKKIRKIRSRIEPLVQLA